MEGGDEVFGPSICKGKGKEHRSAHKQRLEWLAAKLQHCTLTTLGARCERCCCGLSACRAGQCRWVQAIGLTWRTRQLLNMLHQTTIAALCSCCNTVLASDLPARPPTHMSSISWSTWKRLFNTSTRVSYSTYSHMRLYLRANGRQGQRGQGEGREWCGQAGRQESRWVGERTWRDAC